MQRAVTNSPGHCSSGHIDTAAAFFPADRGVFLFCPGKIVRFSLKGLRCGGRYTKIDTSEFSGELGAGATERNAE